MRTWCVLLPLVPLAVGDVVDRSAWVPHITLVGNHLLPESASDVAAAVLRAFAARVGPIHARVEDEAWFGRDGSVLVDLVEPQPLRALHRGLLDAMESVIGGLELLEPDHVRAGYRPHRTVVLGERPMRGAVLEAQDVVLAELEPKGRPGVAVVTARWPLGAPLGEGSVMDAAAVLRVLDALAGIGHWVIGGWGVDALVGCPSRPHHDMDLLVDATCTSDAIDALATAGFTVRSAWSENRWSGTGARLTPSAFVAVDGDGREVDVHTVHVRDGVVTALSDSTVLLPVGALNGTGRIAGRVVPCASAAAQLAMHAGYPLPERQEPDVAILHRLLDR